MKVRKLKGGELLEVGDRIKVDLGGLGTRWESVHRVTPHFAFVRISDSYEAKYKRAVREHGVDAIPYQRSTIMHSAWRPVDQSSAAAPRSTDLPTKGE